MLGYGYSNGFLEGILLTYINSNLNTIDPFPLISMDLYVKHGVFALISFGHTN